MNSPRRSIASPSASSSGRPRCRRNQRGMALLLVLLLGLGMTALLGTAIRGWYAVHAQNRRAQRRLQKRCDGVTITPEPSNANADVQTAPENREP